MTNDEAIAYLERDGNLKVPCSRYGWDTFSCAPYALRAAEIVADATGEGIEERDLDYAMGLVVNDHDDIAYLLAEYGTDDEREEWAEYATAI